MESHVNFRFDFPESGFDTYSPVVTACIACCTTEVPAFTHALVTLSRMLARLKGCYCPTQREMLKSRAAKLRTAEPNYALCWVLRLNCFMSPLWRPEF
jgi:hypothetical protein